MGSVHININDKTESFQSDAVSGISISTKMQLGYNKKNNLKLLKTPLSRIFEDNLIF